MKKFLTVLLMLTLVLSLVACGGEKFDPSAKSEGVMTYEEYAAAAVEAEVVIEGFVQASQKYSAEYGNTSLYLQDPDGAYFVYRLACTAEDAAKFVPGTRVKITGYKSEWSGEVEIVDATFEILEGTWLAEALDVTELLGTDDLIKNQNKFVSFKGMKVEASKDANGNDVPFLYSWDGSGDVGSDLYFNVSFNGQIYNFTVETDLCNAESDIYKAVQALQIGDVIDLEGFLYWYEGANPHITALSK